MLLCIYRCVTRGELVSVTRTQVEHCSLLDMDEF